MRHHYQRIDSVADIDTARITLKSIENRYIDAQGRRVRLLLAGLAPTGPGRATWDGRRDDGSPAEAGVYWAKLRDADGRLLGARRITLLR